MCMGPWKEQEWWQTGKEANRQRGRVYILKVPRLSAPARWSVAMFSALGKWELCGDRRVVLTAASLRFCRALKLGRARRSGYYVFTQLRSVVVCGQWSIVNVQWSMVIRTGTWYNVKGRTQYRDVSQQQEQLTTRLVGRFGKLYAEYRSDFAACFVFLCLVFVRHTGLALVGLCL